ncbi:phosphohydrolase [Spirochaetia bacterium]|nr:phosphohydrolase [Spirochaetia bacterium]
MTQQKIDIVLNKYFDAPVRDSVWGHIYLRPAFESITGSIPFMRLHRIFQLGPTFYVYPGATHTRAAHSIGVYGLARRLLQNLAERGAGEWLSEVGVTSFLCAALLHDAGHFPYTHSLKELALRTHESLTGDIITAEPLRSLIGAAGADPDMAAAIVDMDLPDHGNAELRFYRKLLSGTLDPDKLDYLNRDALYCGVPYGLQDVDFILSQVHPDQEYGLRLDPPGKSSVEALLFAKYLMYKNVYWHKSVRCATAMIKKALVYGLQSGAIGADELYGLDDQELFALLAKHHGPFFELGARVRNGQFYTTLAEVPFEPDLSDIPERSLCEAMLAESFSQKTGKPVHPAEVIIDVPGKVNFETNLQLTAGSLIIPGVFEHESVHTFEKSLEVLRVFVEPALAESLAGIAIQDILYSSLFLKKPVASP